MTLKISLLLDGIDFRDPEACATVPVELSEVFLEATGPMSFATIATDAPGLQAIDQAVDVARMIHKALPGVCVLEAHLELVSVADIAARCRVAPEAVRLWAAGKRRAGGRPFPSVRQTPGASASGGVGRRPMNLYAWHEVVSWVREVLELDPEEGIDFLTARQHAALNMQLSDLGESEQLGKERRADGWIPIGIPQAAHPDTHSGAALYVLDSSVLGAANSANRTGLHPPRFLVDYVATERIARLETASIQTPVTDRAEVG